MAKIHPLSETAYLDMDNTAISIGRQPAIVKKVIPWMMSKRGPARWVAGQMANPFLSQYRPVNVELFDELAAWKRAGEGRKVVAFSDRLERAIPKTKRTLGTYADLIDDWKFYGGKKVEQAKYLQRGATILDDSPSIHQGLWARGFRGHHTLVNFNPEIQRSAMMLTKKARGHGAWTAKILRRFI